MSIFSTALGKWILNIKTSKINGKRIDVFLSARSFFVYFSALDFGFFLSFYILNYFLCLFIKKKKTQWDRLLKLGDSHRINPDKNNYRCLFVYSDW